MLIDNGAINNEEFFHRFILEDINDAFTLFENNPKNDTTRIIVYNKDIIK